MISNQNNNAQSFIENTLNLGFADVKSVQILKDNI